ncbi:electron transfer flavoprotein subunit alpha/FixB family protein [Thaumasiovibrio sp. DFM-14]|uniref:electron transfer flavoprotein subunit alpha/FixB family protein n=1 Tax=Thaumasiovibrio sp. DFM-14 TaxID=3384792 RepID=UPI0039A1BD8E
MRTLLYLNRIADNYHLKRGLSRACLQSISAANAVGYPVDVVIMGANVETTVVTAVTEQRGIDKVIVLDDEQAANEMPDVVTTLLLALMANYSHLIAPACQHAAAVLPRIAAMLDVGMLSDVTKVVSPNEFERPIYAGNAIETVQVNERHIVLTVRASAFEIAHTTSNREKNAIVERPMLTSPTSAVTWLGEHTVDSPRPELASADIVVAGGRGLADKAHFALVEQLADKLGAAVGASRAAVDAGFIGNEFQVGQTGKVVAPQLYIAIGISGAIQHVAGIKGSKVIVAINRDPDAPIFSVADYGLVADLFDVLPALLDALE